MLDIEKLNKLKEAATAIVNSIKEIDIPDKDEHLRKMNRAVAQLDDVIEGKNYLLQHRVERKQAIREHYNKILVDQGPSNEEEYGMYAQEIAKQRNGHKLMKNGLNNKEFFMLSFIDPFNELNANLIRQGKDKNENPFKELIEKVGELTELNRVSYISAEKGECAQR